jgi:hypothetical protein
MSMADDLGKLIMMLNPYTNDPDYPTTPMDIYVGNPNPPPGMPGTTAIPNNYCQVELEVDTKYPSEWTFKQEPQRVNVAARIKYRYGVNPDPKTGVPQYWIEDYLLIGFEGSGGP